MAFKTLFPDTSVPDSPDKLFLDLPLRKHPSLFDHQGQMLRTYAREAEHHPDVAFQLPTGSGKTLVGLLLGEWRRRKNEERVVYFVSDSTTREPSCRGGQLQIRVNR
jgi:superfamily II DNA or RNA helicase